MKAPQLLLCLALAACTAAPAQELRQEQGLTFVSLNPCTDAILAEVADPAQIRALSSYSSDPAASSMDLATARRFSAVSGSVEEVAALRPAVVLDGTFTAPATRSALARLGLRLEQFAIAPTLAESKAQVIRIAALTGHPERGAALVRRIDVALASAAAGRAADAAIPAVVWQSGGIVAGQDTLISDLLARTGFRNAAADRGLRQADLLPLEDMLANPPALILVAGNSATGEDRLLHHPALSALNETRRARLDPSLLWCGGPTIIRAAERLGEVRRAVGQPLARGLRQAQAEREIGIRATQQPPLRLSLSKPTSNTGPAS